MWDLGAYRDLENSVGIFSNLICFGSTVPLIWFMYVKGAVCEKSRFLEMRLKHTFFFIFNILFIFLEEQSGSETDLLPRGICLDEEGAYIEHNKLWGLSFSRRLCRLPPDKTSTRRGVSVQLVRSVELCSPTLHLNIQLCGGFSSPVFLSVQYFSYFSWEQPRKTPWSILQERPTENVCFHPHI